MTVKRGDSENSLKLQ